MAKDIADTSSTKLNLVLTNWLRDFKYPNFFLILKINTRNHDHLGAISKQSYE